jgi:hypothetical protein
LSGKIKICTPRKTPVPTPNGNGARCDRPQVLNIVQIDSQITPNYTLHGASFNLARARCAAAREEKQPTRGAPTRAADAGEKKKMIVWRAKLKILIDSPFRTCSDA